MVNYVLIVADNDNLGPAFYQYTPTPTLGVRLIEKVCQAHRTMDDDYHALRFLLLSLGTADVEAAEAQDVLRKYFPDVEDTTEFGEIVGLEDPETALPELDMYSASGLRVRYLGPS